MYVFTYLNTAPFKPSLAMKQLSSSTQGIQVSKLSYTTAPLLPVHSEWILNYPGTSFRGAESICPLPDFVKK